MSVICYSSDCFSIHTTAPSRKSTLFLFLLRSLSQPLSFLLFHGIPLVQCGFSPIAQRAHFPFFSVSPTCLVLTSTTVQPSPRKSQLDSLKSPRLTSLLQLIHAEIPPSPRALSTPPVILRTSGYPLLSQSRKGTCPPFSKFPPDHLLHA